MRFVTPLLFFAVAGYVHWHNGQDSGEVLLFPFIETLVPSTRGDPVRMGEATVQLLLLVGALLGLRAAWSTWRQRRRAESEASL